MIIRATKPSNQSKHPPPYIVDDNQSDKAEQSIKHPPPYVVDDNQSDVAKQFTDLNSSAPFKHEAVIFGARNLEQHVVVTPQGAPAASCPLSWITMNHFESF
jgi:hypothetical protein